MSIFEGAGAKTPDLIEELDDFLSESEPVIAQTQAEEQEAQGRQKSVAALQPVNPHAVLARLSGPMTNTSAAFIAA